MVRVKYKFNNEFNGFVSSKMFLTETGVSCYGAYKTDEKGNVLACLLTSSKVVVLQVECKNSRVAKTVVKRLLKEAGVQFNTELRLRTKNEAESI